MIMSLSNWNGNRLNVCLGIYWTCYFTKTSLLANESFFVSNHINYSKLISVFIFSAFTHTIPRDLFSTRWMCCPSFHTLIPHFMWKTNSNTKRVKGVNWIIQFLYTKPSTDSNLTPRVFYRCVDFSVEGIPYHIILLSKHCGHPRAPGVIVFSL